MIALTRLDNWQTYLTQLINNRRYRPIEWGEHDCALWTADTTLVITGVDFAVDARGTYDTPSGAYKCLKTIYEVDNLKEVYTSRFPEKEIIYARQGDLVYQNSNYEGFNVAMGVCNGSQSFFIHDPEDEVQGLFMMPTLDCDGCFQIG